MSSSLQIILSYSLTYIHVTISVKLTTFNTHQIFTNPYASTILPTQIDQIVTSDSDVLCLQELYNAQKVNEYLSALQAEGYTNSFSAIDIYAQVAPENLEIPRMPCDEAVISALNSTCMRQACLPLYTQSTVTYAACAATYCPNDYAQIMYTECGWCMAAIPTLQPALNDFELAVDFCGDPPAPFNNILFNFTDGNAIVTKTEYPIVNTWSINLPSWIYVERRLLIAEINICAETDPNNEKSDCSDSMIFGCTLLDGQEYKDDSGVVQSVFLDNDEISSLSGLNRYQSQTIVDKIFNNNLLSILGIEENEENIFGVILAGDINNGQMFSRCEWRNEQGELNADNCDINPSNAWDIWQLYGFVDASDVAGEDVLCTWCGDQTSSDFNPWLLFEWIANPNLIPDFGHDIDKILIQDGYCDNYKNVLFQREFTEKIINLPGGLFPTSNHYAVSVDIEFGENEGGRDDDTNCRGEDGSVSVSLSSSEDSVDNAMYVGDDLVSSNEAANVAYKTNVIVKFDSSLWILFCTATICLCVNLVFCVCWYKIKQNRNQGY